MQDRHFHVHAHHNPEPSVEFRECGMRTALLTDSNPQQRNEDLPIAVYSLHNVMFTATHSSKTATRSSAVAVIADRTPCRSGKKLITAWFLFLNVIRDRNVSTCEAVNKNVTRPTGTGAVIRAKPIQRWAIINYWQTIRPLSVTSLGLRTAGTHYAQSLSLGHEFMNAPKQSNQAWQEKSAMLIFSSSEQ